MKMNEYIWIVLLLELVLFELTTGWYRTFWIVMVFSSLLLYVLNVIAMFMKPKVNK